MGSFDAEEGDGVAVVDGDSGGVNSNVKAETLNMTQKAKTKTKTKTKTEIQQWETTTVSKGVPRRARPWQCAAGAEAR